MAARIPEGAVILSEPLRGDAIVGWFAAPLWSFYGRHALLINRDVEEQHLRSAVDHWCAQGRPVYVLSQHDPATWWPGPFSGQPVGEFRWRSSFIGQSMRFPPVLWRFDFRFTAYRVDCGLSKFDSISEIIMDRRLRVLFITRKYPPSVGGMERLSYRLVENMRKRAEVYVIAWSRTQIGLPWFLICALIRGLRIARKVDIVHAGDPLVGLVVWFLGRLYHLPIVVNVHGLDLVFKFPFYRALVSRLLRQFSRVVCISHAVCLKSLELGLEFDQCRVIHPGIDIPKEIPGKDLAREHIETWLGKPLDRRQIWLTVGRLIPRKGVAWFCEQVLPRLQSLDRVIYLIVGTGPEAQHIREIIYRFDLANHVYLLGFVDDERLSWLYAGADAFIMPNIPQPNDMEGFGMVAIEAAVHGLPVIAARLDGIPDAVIEGESGYLLPPGDVRAWVDFLEYCLTFPPLLQNLRSRAQHMAIYRFGWDRIIESYLKLYHEIVDL